MNPRTTGILLLVAVALAAFVYFYEIEGEAGRQEAEERAKQLFPDVDEDDVDAIAFETSDGASARLERRDERWVLTEPLAFPADGFAADSLASNLAGLVSEAELEQPQPPEEYGLGAGARLLRFRAGDAEYGLRLGNDTPIGGNAYAMVDGGEKIVTVKSYQAKSFEKSLADLRDRRILDFDRSGVVRIEARWPGGSVALERAPGDSGAPEAEAADDAEVAAPPDRSWRIVAPIEAAADQQVVDRLLSDLSFLRADDFVDDPPDEAAASLAEPAFEVILTAAAEGDGESTTHRIAIGEPYEGVQRLVRAGQPSLYAIAADRLSGLPRTLVEYRHRTMAKFSAADAAQVDFFFQPQTGDPVVVTSLREGEDWSSSPEPIATGKVERLVAELSQLKAGDILADSAEGQDLAALGLSPPNTIITVFGRPEAQDVEAGDAAGEGAVVDPPERPLLAEIQLGRVEASEWIVARAAGDPAIYRLDYELADHLPVSLDALRNRFLAPEPPAVPEETGQAEFLSPSQESP